jgi:hypothetical protein
MTDALLEAEALLKELPDAVARRHLGERLQQALLVLETADREIARIGALFQLSKILDFGKTAEQHDALEEMRDCTTEIGSLLEKTDDAEGVRLAVYEYEKTLKKRIVEVERGIRAQWRKLANERFVPLISIGEMLKFMNVPADLGYRLVDCGQRGKDAAVGGTATDFLTAVRALFTELEVLQEALAGETGHDEVGSFINALAENRATLAMVTPNVHTWLEKHSALERLGISLR